MGVSVKINSAMTVTEALSNSAAPFASATNGQVVHDKLNDAKDLGVSTTPPLNAFVGVDVALVTGAATIDLTSLVGANGSYNATGKKLIGIKIRNKAGNSGSITISKGASNGYTGLGSSFSLTLPASNTAGSPPDVMTPWAFIFLGTNSVAVASGNKTLDLAGTGTQHVELGLLFN